MAALHGRNLASTVGSLFPCIGSALLAELLPAMRVAAPPPSAAGGLQALTGYFPALLRTGAGASQQASSGLSKALEVGSGAPMNQVAPLAAYSRWNRDVGYHSGTSSGSFHIFPGIVAATAGVGLCSYIVGEHLEERFLEDAKGTQFTSLMTDIFVGAGDGGILYCNGDPGLRKNPPPKKENGDDKDSPPPPPPPGKGPRGLSDRDREIFIKLLIELQNQLKRVLDGKDSSEEVIADLTKKASMLELTVDDLEETKAAVEALLKELKEKDGLLQLMRLVEKFGKDLTAMEDRLKGKKKPGLTVTLEKMGMSGGAASWVQALWSSIVEIIKFVESKFMLLVGVAACYTCGVWPIEFFTLALQLLKDTIEDNRAKIEKLQKKVAGVENEEAPDAVKVMLELKQMLSEQGGDIKVVEGKLQGDESDPAKAEGKLQGDAKAEVKK